MKRNRFLFLIAPLFLVVVVGQGGSVAAQSEQPSPFSLKFKDNKKKSSERKVSREENASQAKALMSKIDKLLERVSQERNAKKKLPSRKDYIVAVPPWTETKEDRDVIIRSILDSTLEIVTESPVVHYQKTMRAKRKTILSLKEQIASLKERRLDAPKDSLLPFTETVSSIDDKIKELKLRITENHKEIDKIKGKIRIAFTRKKIEMSNAQLDLLLGSVLSGDIVKLLAAFEAARLIDKRLGELLSENNEDLRSARRYFAMHSALFSMLLHAQNEILLKIDNVYLKRLDEILVDLRKTRRKTIDLLRQKNRIDQRRTLLANRKAQDLAENVAVFYKDYLKVQRHKIAESRNRTYRDLSIADNTYETVEASFQLRALIDDAQSSFQALERLEAPGFGQIFRNEELRKEFEKLTEKLQVPSS